MNYRIEQMENDQGIRFVVVKHRKSTSGQRETSGGVQLYRGELYSYHQTQARSSSPEIPSSL